MNCVQGQINQLEELQNSWRKEELHKNEVFNFDGIVDSEQWEEVENKKILFLLKEAHHKNITCKEYSDKYKTTDYCLTSDLRKNGPWKMWLKVAEWAYAINETNIEKIANYSEFFKEYAGWEKQNEIIRQISVVNLKKSAGTPSSDNDNLATYLNKDKTKLFDQISIIDPQIIVCGSTFKFFKEIVGADSISERNDNWFYFWKDKIVIDFYHPANQFPKLMNFYSLAAIYQRALIAKNKY